VGQVTVKVLERVPIPRAQAERETLALRWLLEFVQASPDELPSLFSLSSGFGAFAFLGKGYFGQPSLPKLKRFHNTFAQAIRATLAGQGKTGWRIKVPTRPASCWYLFQKAHGLESYFDGCWELGFLDRVNALLAKFGADIKACPACTRIFLAEHGLQKYCSRACNERQRQRQLRVRRIKKIHDLQAEIGTRLTPAEVQNKLGIKSLAEARKYLNLANREHDDGK